MQIILVNLSSALIYLLPLALLTGPAIPDIFIVTVSIIFLYLTTKNKDFKYFKNRYFYFFLIFYLYLILRSFFSEEMYISLRSSLPYIRFFLFSLAIWYLIDNQKNFIKYFSIIFLFTFILAICDGFYQFFNDTNLFNIESSSHRMSLLLNASHLLGRYLVFLFPFLFGLIIFRLNEKRYNILLLFFLFICTDIIIFLTGERTAFFLMFLATVFLIIFLSKLKLLRIATFFISLIFIAAISFFLPDVRDENINRTMDQITGKMEILTDDGDYEISKVLISPHHHSHFLTSYKMFRENILFGKGPNTFKVLCDQKKYLVEWKYLNRPNLLNGCSTHPHNFYVQILAETGLVGMIFLIIIVGYFLLSLRKNINFLGFNHKDKYSDFQLCMVAGFFLALWPAVPTQDFFNNWNNILIYLPLGFYLYSKNYSKK